MTPAGEVSIQITGDYSALQSDFDSAASIAESSGNQIASALDIAMARADALSGSLDEVNTSLESTDSAANSAQSTLDALRDAFSGASSNAESASEEVKHVGESAHESGIDLKEMAITLAEFAGLAIGVEAIAEAMKELAIESLSVYAQTQRAEVALATFTGSAEAAEEIVTKMKELAQDNALSFPQVLTAAQRMTAMGLTAEEVASQIQRTADIAFVSGRGFDEVAAALERMTLSGILSSRQLVQLGVNMDAFIKALENLGDLEELDAAGAKKLFAALDMEDRIKVIDAATNKFAGDGKQAATTLSGAWQGFKTQFELAMDGVGKAMASATSSILSGTSNLVKNIRGLFEPNMGFPSAEEAADTGNKWAAGLNLPKITIQGDTLKGHIQAAFDAMNEGADAAALHVTGLSNTFSELANLLSLSRTMYTLEAFDQTLKNVEATNTKTLTSMATQWGKAGDWVSTVKSEIASTLSVTDDLVAKLYALPEGPDAGVKAVVRLQAAMSEAYIAQTQLSDGLAALGVKSAATYAQQADTAITAYNQVRSSGMATALEIEAAWIAMEKAVSASALREGDITVAEFQKMQKQIAGVAADLNNKLGNGAANVWQNAASEAQRALTRVGSELGRTIAQGLIEARSLGQAFQQLGAQIASTFLGIAINAMVKWLAQLLGLTAAGKAAMSAADVAQVTGQAGVAFAAGYASVMAALPFPANIAAAPGIAAAAAGQTLSGGIPLATFQKGGYVPEDMIALVHAGEHISPAGSAPAGGPTIVINGPFNGVTRDTINEIGQQLLRGIRLAGVRTGSL